MIEVGISLFQDKGRRFERRETKGHLGEERQKGIKEKGDKRLEWREEQCIVELSGRGNNSRAEQESEGNSDH